MWILLDNVVDRSGGQISRISNPHTFWYPKSINVHSSLSGIRKHDKEFAIQATIDRGFDFFYLFLSVEQ
jgi:hypothetical protein